MPTSVRTIQANQLTKRYGPVLALDRLTFEVLPGRVTGFLGPNGAGKSTTMRLILGLDAPTAGGVTVGGIPYRSLRRPLFEVGAMLESSSAHPGRSAHAHLLALAQANEIGRRRVDEVLGLVGLDQVAGRAAGTFSLGMTQRLGVAAALLGDPGVLLLDEPVNGLDPEGVIWIRTLLRSLAAEGRTVFVSSHLMSEMAQTADQVIVIGRGRLITDTSVQELLRGGSGRQVRVRSPQTRELAELLRAEGAAVDPQGEGVLVVRGADAATVGELAARHGVVLHELVAREGSLEEAFMDLTRDAVDYQQPTHTGRTS
jgi:ABC-2 type transport system ATP-binding protein